jgi:hypothetical protein
VPEPPHPRHRAVAELDAHIAQAEEMRAKYLLDLRANPGSRRAGVPLRLAESHLARLRRTREVLVAREDG